MFKALKRRFLLSNMLLTMAVLLGAFAAIFSSAYLSARGDAKTKLLALPELYNQGSAVPIPSAGRALTYLADVKMSAQKTESAYFFVILVNGDGAISANDPARDVMEEYYRSLVQKVWNQKGTRNVVTFPKEARQAYVVSSARYVGEYEVYFLDIAPYKSALSQLLRSFLWILPLSLLPVFLVSLYLAKRSVAPIEEAWQRQRQFVADASHELKTPLAILAANADALATEDGSEKEKWLGYIQDETRRMAKLVNDLLYLAKTDSAGQGQPAAVFNMSRCTRDMVTRYEAVAYERGISLQSDVADDVQITGEEEKVCKVISILLDNASKYTNENGSITLSLHKQKRTAVLTVENTGDGIPAAVIPHLFERFYRADKARTGENGSFGLGLSIAESIAQQIGGQLSAHSIEGKSTTFVFRLPAQQI